MNSGSILCFNHDNRNFSRWIASALYCGVILVSTFLSSVEASSTGTAWLQHPKLLTRPVGDSDSATARTLTNQAYIIRFTNTTSDVNGTIANLMRNSIQDGGQIRYVFTKVFKGVSVINMSNARMINILDASVVVSASQVSKVSSAAAVRGVAVEAAATLKTQKRAIWNLDSLVFPRSDSKYKYRYSGKGVNVYIIDTGINVNNSEFSNRASCGWYGYGTSCVDNRGHGTHVAGTVGSKTYGVAKQAKLVAVKVIADNGYGDNDVVIAGIDWVLGQKLASPTIPMVINFSLISEFDQFLNDAVQAAVNGGITTVVAAGNDWGRNACSMSPASVPDAITVGATDINRNQAYFTNSGPCVDIMAPGINIKSVSSIKSGTSMSTPHVAGMAALHLQKNKALTPAKVWKSIQNDALKDVINNIYGYNTPNLLLFASSILKYK